MLFTFGFARNAKYLSFSMTVVVKKVFNNTKLLEAAYFICVVYIYITVVKQQGIFRGSVNIALLVV